MFAMYFQDSSPSKVFPLKDSSIKIDRSNKNTFAITFPDIQMSGNLKGGQLTVIAIMLMVAMISERGSGWGLLTNSPQF